MTLVLLVAIVASLSLDIPTPTWAPEPTPAPTATATPDPTPTLDPMPAGDISTQPEDTAHAAGPVALTVRACVDTNTDGRCTLGEGVEGLPVAILDTQTGAVLATALTDPEGLAHAGLTLSQQAELSIDVPYLALSQPFFPGQRGAEIVVPAVTLPKVLP